MTSCQAFYCTNKKGKCEKNYFCNYRSYPCQHIDKWPRKTQESRTALETKKKKACVHIKLVKSDNYLTYAHSCKTSNSNMTSFFRFVKKLAIYRFGIISWAHAPVHVTDFPIVNVYVNELWSARIWQHKLCATLSANVNINYRLPIKVYYRICTHRHIRIEINHGSQNVFWGLTWVGRN